MKEFLTDIDGQFSSKRLMTFMAFFLFVVTWAIDLFTALEPNDNIVDSLTWMIGVGMGTVVAEKFSRKRADTINTGPQVNVDLSGAPKEGL